MVNSIAAEPVAVNARFLPLAVEIPSHPVIELLLNGMLAVMVVCPSLQIQLLSPSAISWSWVSCLPATILVPASLSAAHAPEPVLTPLVLLKVPEPLNAISHLL